MELFNTKLKENRSLLVISYIFFGAIIFEGIQVLIYPLVIFGKLVDYHRIIAEKILPFYYLFDPIIIFPFIVINISLRIIAFINLRKMNKKGKIFGLISLIYSIILIIVMLPVNIFWEPPVLVVLIIVLLKGYKIIELENGQKLN